MIVVLGESAGFVKSNEIFSPLVCMATMVGNPGAGSGEGTDASIAVDVRFAKGSTTAGGPLGVPPLRERLPNGIFPRGSTSSRPARGAAAVDVGADVGGAGPSRERRSNNMSAPPAECLAEEVRELEPSKGPLPRRSNKAFPYGST